MRQKLLFKKFIQSVEDSKLEKRRILIKTEIEKFL